MSNEQPVVCRKTVSQTEKKERRKEKTKRRRKEEIEGRREEWKVGERKDRGKETVVRFHATLSRINLLNFTDYNKH